MMLNVSDEYKSGAIQISEYAECCVIAGSNSEKEVTAALPLSCWFVCR